MWLAGEAAELEETVEKPPVTPGPLLPARELMGNLLVPSPPAAGRAFTLALPVPY